MVGIKYASIILLAFFEAIDVQANNTSTDTSVTTTSPTTPALTTTSSAQTSPTTATVSASSGTTSASATTVSATSGTTSASAPSSSASGAASMTSGATTAASSAATTTSASTKPVVTTTKVSTRKPWPKPNCGNRNLNNGLRRIFLYYHNELRGSLARGQTQASYGWGIAPPATLMYRMKYDCNAESYAQQAVNSCRRTELPAYATGGHKQNLFIFNSGRITTQQAALYAIKQWWSQLARFGMRSNMMFYQSEYHRGARNVLNWAKMAWWSTRYVGCAVKNCGSFYAVSCMYYPGGANVNQYVYQVGAVCSGCPRGQCDGQALCRWG